jgi:apolipoprotein N-acyltransferase
MLLVQTNVPSIRKNEDAAGIPSPFNQAYQLTRERLTVDGADGRTGYDLVLWPETTTGLITAAIPGSPLNQPSPLSSEPTPGKNGISIRGIEAGMISELCRTHNVSILTGANNAGSGKDLYNLSVLVAPDGSAVASAKQRLVPFGERAPYAELLPFLARFAPEPPVVRGEQSEPLPLKVTGQNKAVPIGSLICFESCFPEPARPLRRAGAQLFAVLTNDEWAGGTTSPGEHAAMATVRAIENRVPVVQAANGGYSFVVDPCGRFVVKSSFGKAETLSVTVPLN